LIKAIFAKSPEPALTLSDAVELSNIYRASARLHRRGGQLDQADGLQARRLELWQRWDKKMPNNPFVRLQLEAARERPR